MKFSLFVEIFAIFFVSASASAKCNLPEEFYQEKVSEACRAHLVSQATDAQDKIYLERILKNWKPMTDYEILHEDGFLEVVNTVSGEVDQLQWISYESPAILYFNGQVVAETVANDGSIFRRIQRLIESAEKANATEGKSALRRLLEPNRANAATANTQVAAFVFQLDADKKGKAAVILGAEADSESSFWRMFAGGSAYIKQNGILPDTRDKKFQCDANKVRGDVPQKLGEQEIVINQEARDKATVKGLLPDKQVLKVTMPKHGQQRVVEIDPATGKEKLVRYQGRMVTRNILGRACQDKYNPTVAEKCKKAWDDFANSRATDAEKGEVRSYIQRVTQGRQGSVLYGRDFKCAELYKHDHLRGEAKRANVVKLESCNRAMADVIPAGNLIKAGAARYQVCNEQGQSCKAIDAAELARLRNMGPPVGRPGGTFANDPQTARVTMERQHRQLQDRKAYEEAVKAAVAAAPRGSGVTLADICPAGIPNGTFRVPQGVPRDVTRSFNNDRREFTKFDFAECKAPNKAPISTYIAAGAKRNRLAALFQKTKNPDRQIANERGEVARGDIEKRIMGMMMLGDCCGNRVCMEHMKQKLGIELTPDAKSQHVR